MTATTSILPRRKTKRPAKVEVLLDPIQAADEAGLRYVSDEQPGYTRRRRGKDFAYFDTEGKEIRDETRILRIRRLAIPPAYTEVWICPSANGHLQATGRDDRGRKQYRYHERWREVRDENKYEKMLFFARALPKMRRRVKKDLAAAGLSRNKVLATIVQLLEKTFIRVGNEEYAKQNKSFGLTTMLDRHVEVRGEQVRFHFRGKSGREHEIPLSDRRIARIVKKLQDLPGQNLFQYRDENGELTGVTSEDVNSYLREITGEDFTAKDFRTWAGTVLALTALRHQGIFETKTAGKKNVTDSIKAVARILGNTPTVCRKCYVHPVVLDAYLEGTLLPALDEQTKRGPTKSLGGLRTDEAMVLTFLQKKLAPKSGKRPRTSQKPSRAKN